MIKFFIPLFLLLTGTWTITIWIQQYIVEKQNSEQSLAKMKILLDSVWIQFQNCEKYQMGPEPAGQLPLEFPAQMYWWWGSLFVENCCEIFNSRVFSHDFYLVLCNSVHVHMHWQYIALHVKIIYNVHLRHCCHRHCRDSANGYNLFAKNKNKISNNMFLLDTKKFQYEA